MSLRNLALIRHADVNERDPRFLNECGKLQAKRVWEELKSLLGAKSNEAHIMCSKENRCVHTADWIGHILGADHPDFIPGLENIEPTTKQSEEILKKIQELEERILIIVGYGSWNGHIDFLAKEFGYEGMTFQKSEGIFMPMREGTLEPLEIVPISGCEEVD